MPFSPGDRVHLAGLGTGDVIDVRGADRYAIAIKGRVVVASGRDLEAADVAGRPRKPRSHDEVRPRSGGDGPAGSIPSLDLHGKTVDAAIEAVIAFVNDALVAGHPEVRIIHGRSGGRLKTAVHHCLERVSSVAAIGLDPRNAGVTIVTFV
jgi:DNA mismatch repair protein MutS2